MKKNVFILSALIISLFMFSCQKESNNIETNLQFPNVDPELWPYYAAFETEARSRGFDYDLEALNILGDIEEIHQENVAGSCKYGSHINNEVTIDQSFWNRSSNLYKEFVVFHELGHCVLLRGHDESANNQGQCLSIMRSGTGSCRDSYSHQNREAYLDELFYQN